VVAVTLVATVGARHFATPGVSYKLTVTTEPPDMMRQNGMRNVVLKAHGVATSNRQRLDLDELEPNATLLMPHDYFLMLDTGKTTQVSMQNSIYTNNFSLSGAVGMGAVLPISGQNAGMVANLTVARIQTKLDTLGDKDVISGYPTRHFRITLDYAMMTGQAEIPLHAVIEVWTAQLPVKLTDPFQQIAVLDSAGPMQALFDKMAQIRAQLGGGVALRTITTTTLDISGMGGGGGGMPPLVIVQKSEFSDIKDTDVDPAQFTIPRGFSKSG
jgi:hypothetical protein